MSLTTPGVVERASKEISRRIHSLGFKTSSKKNNKSNDDSDTTTATTTAATDSGDPGEGATAVPDSSKTVTEKKKVAAKADKQQQLINESDRLNGNNPSPQQQQDRGEHGVALQAGFVSTPPGSPSPSGYRNMGSIIKGSVMDKVTNVFSGGNNMGNTSNKDSNSASAAANSAAASACAAASKASDASATAANNAINIPKGAVANGRAKFEAQKVSPEKPIRFFGSRSRTNSPMLPVKTPKVPPVTGQNGSGDGASKTGLTTTNNNKKPEPVKSPGSGSSSAISDQSKTPSVVSKFLPKMKKFVSWQELWRDSKFLLRFFSFFTSAERCMLAQVCPDWRDILYGQPEFWREVRPVLHCRDIRSWSSSANSPVSVTTSTTSGSISNGSIPANSVTPNVTLTSPPEDTTPSPGTEVMAATTASLSECDALKQNYFNSLKLRGFDTFCLLNANDADVFDFIQNFPHGAKHVHSLILRCCNISDRGLEALMEFLQALYKLEIAGCNEITEQGLWSSLHPRLVSLTVNDCINVADECVCAVTQLLPALYEFNLQAYHVTDSALSYFSPKQTGTLNILRLQSCWEITNHGIVNIVHTLPNLTVLSLSGCSKITDDGIELIAENLRKLRSLDISWCPRVTDAALEYIACDLNNLEELTLDRCVHITDIGIGYISTMLALHTLYLRWCTQIRDFGLQHICGMRSMQILSLAGCSLLTSSGLSNLIQLRHLQELELTNCPGAAPELIEYLRQNLPKCLVLD